MGVKVKTNTKVLAVSLSALTLLAAVSGCGSTSTSISTKQTSGQNVTTITFWDFLTGGDGSTMDKVIAEFNKTHPTIHVDHITQGWGSDYATKVIANILANKGPDIAMAHGDEVLRWESKGVLDSWDSLIASSNIQWSDFSNQSLQDAVINGQHYYVPLDVNSFVMFYNKSILGKDGLLNKNGTLTIDNYNYFLKILTTVKEDGSVPFSYPENGLNPLALWYMFYLQMGGGPILNSAKTQVNFTTSQNLPIAIKAMQDVYDLYNTSQVIPTNVSNSISLFQAGKAAITIDGTWNVNYLASSMGKSFGVTSIPAFFGDEPYAYANAHVIVLPKNSQRTPAQDKAISVFLEWFNSHEWMWAQSGHIPAVTAILQSSQYKSLPYQKYYQSELKYANFWPATSSVWFVDDSELNNVVQGILLKKIPVQTGVQQMASTVNSQLSQGY